MKSDFERGLEDLSVALLEDEEFSRDRIRKIAFPTTTSESLLCTCFVYGSKWPKWPWKWPDEDSL